MATAITCPGTTEGPSDDSDIQALRLRQIRNLIATTLFSQGTPMLLAGDELLRTQQGNNNAYCQDNEISWLDWNLDGDAHAMIEYVRQVNALRLRYPILRRGRFLSGDYNEEMGLKEVTWLAPDGNEMDVERWEDTEARTLGLLLDGRAQPSGIRRAGADDTLLLLFNAHHDAVAFQLPEAPSGSGWRCRLDTSQTMGDAPSPRAFGEEHVMEGRSLALLELVQQADNTVS